MNHLGDYDVIVIGAGHAGIEAAHAAAMLGAKTPASAERQKVRWYANWTHWAA